MDIPTQICVGVPIYNEEKYISETLKSLKSQNIDNVHFLISDNQSTDNTLEICRNEVGDDERFSIIQHKENIGAAENFKFALDKSQRSEEHTSELQSLMRISYAVFCLKHTHISTAPQTTTNKT